MSNKINDTHDSRIKYKTQPNMTTGEGLPVAVKAVADWNNADIFSKEFIQNPYVASNFLWFANGPSFISNIDLNIGPYGNRKYDVSFSREVFAGTFTYDAIKAAAKIGASVGNDFTVSRGTISVDIFDVSQTDIDRLERDTEDSYSGAVSTNTVNSINRLFDNGAARYFTGAFDNRLEANDLDFDFMDGTDTDEVKGKTAYNLLKAFIVSTMKKIGPNISGVDKSAMGIVISFELGAVLDAYYKSGNFRGDAPKFAEGAEQLMGVYGVEMRDDKAINLITTGAGTGASPTGLSERPYVSNDDVKIHCIVGVRAAYWGDFTIFSSAITPFGKGSDEDVLSNKSLSGHGTIDDTLYGVGYSTLVVLAKEAGKK